MPLNPDTEMNTPFLAHRSDNGQNEPLLQHLKETASLTAQFCSTFNASEDGYIAGLCHDIGKYSEAFQRRLFGSTEKVDHSTAGAFECVLRQHILIAFAIAGHHGGLPDGGTSTDNDCESTFHARIKRARNHKLANYEEWKKEVSVPEKKTSFPRDPRAAVFYTRMLYSSLVDADFLCTESFMNLNFS